MLFLFRSIDPHRRSVTVYVPMKARIAVAFRRNFPKLLSKPAFIFCVPHASWSRPMKHHVVACVRGTSCFLLRWSHVVVGVGGKHPYCLTNTTKWLRCPTNFYDEISHCAPALPPPYRCNILLSGFRPSSARYFHCASAYTEHENTPCVKVGR